MQLLHLQFQLVQQTEIIGSQTLASIYSIRAVVGSASEW